MLACKDSTQSLLDSDYDVFLDIVKHSDVDNNFLDDERLIEKYVSRSKILAAFPKRKPEFIDRSIKMIYDAEFGSPVLNPNFPHHPDSFKPFITPIGLCHAFNSLAMGDIFQPHKTVKSWSRTFGSGTSSELINATGSGPENGAFFILNSFRQVTWGNENDFGNTNFVVSVTNVLNGFEIYKHRYTLSPGYVYNFRVIADQMVATDRFKKLGPAIRECRLQHENYGPKLFKRYSKTGCIFEVPSAEIPLSLTEIS